MVAHVGSLGPGMTFAAAHMGFLVAGSGVFVVNDALWPWILVLRNTLVKDVLVNLCTSLDSSGANGGPSSIVIRLLMVSSLANGPNNRAYPLSAEPPKIMCLQWGMDTWNLQSSIVRLTLVVDWC